MVGPLPLREAPSNAAANSVGSAPCWRHLLRVPLPPALIRILRSASPANRTGGSASATAVVRPYYDRSVVLCTLLYGSLGFEIADAFPREHDLNLTRNGDRGGGCQRDRANGCRCRALCCIHVVNALTRRRWNPINVVNNNNSVAMQRRRVLCCMCVYTDTNTTNHLCC